MLKKIYTQGNSLISIHCKKQLKFNRACVSVPSISFKSLAYKQFHCFAKVSWKKLMESYNYTDNFYNDFSVMNVNPKIDTPECSILIYPLSPQIQRTQQNEYLILKYPFNFLLTYLQKFNGMDYEQMWKNRKSIGISLKDIFLLQKYKIGNPSINIIKFKKQDNNQKTKKRLTISTIQNQQSQQAQISIKFQIITQGPERDLIDWQSQVKMSQNEFSQFVLGSKKNIYNLSGMKLNIQFQKREIIQKLSKKSVKEQTTISSTGNMEGLLD